MTFADIPRNHRPRLSYLDQRDPFFEHLHRLPFSLHSYLTSYLSCLLPLGHILTVHNLIYWTLVHVLVKLKSYSHIYIYNITHDARISFVSPPSYASIYLSKCSTMETVERFLDLEAQVGDDEEEEMDDEDEMRRSSPSPHNLHSHALTWILQVISLSTATKRRRRKRPNFIQRRLRLLTIRAPRICIKWLTSMMHAPRWSVGGAFLRAMIALTQGSASTQRWGLICTIGSRQANTRICSFSRYQ